VLFTPPEPTLAEQEVAAHYRRFRDEFLAWAWKHTRAERRTRRMSSWRQDDVIDLGTRCRIVVAPRSMKTLYI